MERNYVYPASDRIWHWIHAISIAMLVLTAIPIHFPSLRFMDLETAVHLHTFFGLLVAFDFVLYLINMFFYGSIKNYLPRAGDGKQAVLMAKYYLWGIFRGEEEPFHPKPGRRLNPLQKPAYFVVMFILIPIQIFTGLLIWRAAQAESLINSLGGLKTVSLIHIANAYLLAAYLLFHIYLGTTGKTVWYFFKVMITGYADE